MAQSIADGPWGLESPHRWIAPARTTNPDELIAEYLFNDLSAALPRVRFDDMPGFHSRPEVDNVRTPLTSRWGSRPLPSRFTAKTFTVTGRVQATSAPEARQTMQAVQRLWNDPTREGLWKIEPRADMGGIVTNHWVSNMRCTAFEPEALVAFGEHHPLGPWQFTFQAGFEMSDPRFYWDALQDSGEEAAQFTVTNLGSAPTDPIIDVRVPSAVTGFANLAVYSDFAGTKVESSIRQGDGPGWLRFDFPNRDLIFTPDGGDPVNYRHMLRVDQSDAWDRGADFLIPGDNTIRSDSNGDFAGFQNMRLFHFHAAF